VSNDDHIPRHTREDQKGDDANCRGQRPDLECHVGGVEAILPDCKSLPWGNTSFVTFCGKTLARTERSGIWKGSSQMQEHAVTA